MPYPDESLLLGGRAYAAFRRMPLNANGPPGRGQEIRQNRGPKTRLGPFQAFLDDPGASICLFLGMEGAGVGGSVNCLALDVRCA